jgi:3-oxoacyl-[acyl-carrier-protein] synthase III
MNDVYITGTGRFLPGNPISNQEMEEYLGKIHGKASRLRQPVLRKNGIKTRYYSLNKDGTALYSNAQMAALAIKQALNEANREKDELDYLATSTTQGDLIVPGFASSVHAELGSHPLEIASFQSVCASSTMALKAAYLSVKTNEANLAAVSGSEFSSRWFRAGKYEDCVTVAEADRPPIESEFLRWTLSDGAGAVILSSQKKPKTTNLKIEWIELKSYADKFPPCMYAGSDTNRGEMNFWGLYNNPSLASKDSAIILKQDVALLYQLFPVWVGFYLETFKKKDLDAMKIDHFLPHYSSESLGQEMKKLLNRTGSMIPENKWFNNVKKFGNTGTASIFILLDDFLRNTPLQMGDKVLCFVPESGQCSVSFIMLTVV